ncbi:MAG: hypothetical protein ACTHJT_08940 [Cytophaga sp.]|uniref:hypothetical protein n=1 Tax=Cytophaga sp. TaxID=29535 RepID=UPI003F7FA60D
MKYIHLIVWFIGIAYMQHVHAQSSRPANPNELGISVCKAFRFENFSAYDSLIFTNADCDIMIKNADAPQNAKDTVINQMYSITRSMRGKALENFQSVIKAGKDKGIKWNKIELVNVFFEIRNRKNIESCDVAVYCKEGGKVFVIMLNNCHKSDAWLMMGNTSIQFK